MISLIIGAGCLIVLFVFILTNKKKNKQLLQLQASWGKANEEYRNFDWIEQFSKFKKEPLFHQLSPQTINDLDFNELFKYVDRTVSKPGQQYLYYQLLRPTDNMEALNEFDSQVDFFQNNDAIRETIQLQLLQLSNPSAHYISSLLSSDIYKKPTWAIWLKVDTAVVVILLILAFQFKILFIGLMLLFGLNMLLHLWNKEKAFQFVKSLPQLSELINTAKKINTNKRFNNKTVAESINNLNTFKNLFKFVNFSTNSVQSDISQVLGMFFMESIKGLFLIEVHSFISCMDELKNKKEDIVHLFEFIGLIDAAISIASLRKENADYCKPEFIQPGKCLSLRNIYHPLIRDCVTNSLEIDQKSILITGSNMSGKTTFIRTVAINSILAQTIYTCFADSFVTPLLKVVSSIRIEDNLLDGNSYFFEEVKTIDTLIKATATTAQNLFILDELFKGTNTIERVAAAKAVLHYLNKRNNIVLVSTHDLELSECLKDNYDLYHFEEQIVEDTLSFDHLLKKGKLKTSNAIRLLELSGYPKEIIDEAKEAIEK